MPAPVTRRLSLALPILFYLLSLVALRLHLPTGDTPLLLLAVAAGLASLLVGAALVLHQRATLGRALNNRS